MPTESPAETGAVPGTSGGGALPPPASLKCSSCGAASLGPMDGVIVLGDKIERVCAACVRAGSSASTAPLNGAAQATDTNTGAASSLPAPSPSSAAALGLGLSGLSVSSPHRDAAVVIDLANVARLRSPSRCRHSLPGAADAGNTDSPAPSETSLPPAHDSTCAAEEGAPAPQTIPMPARESEPPVLTAKSLPATRTAPWATATIKQAPSPTAATPIAPDFTHNALLDVGHKRVRSESRGCLYPGSVFKGTQRSGRSAYDVEVRFVDVNFHTWTVCGYLTIANLTDTHPELTTFFDGEIIGPKHGFVTGQRYGATEVDDRRHWERFEQFLRPSTKADIVRPEMLLRDPLPNLARGETQPRERDFFFLRIKEKFLVPDHHVRDICGASFAGFYYAMVDMAPALEPEELPSPLVVPRSPLAGRRTSLTTTPRPDSPRRASSANANRRASTSTTSATASVPTRPDAPRRQSSSRAVPEPRVATLKGYYFHSLNNEFQELSLRHVPSVQAGTFELR